MKKFCAIATALCLAISTAATAATVKYDFGDSAQLTDSSFGGDFYNDIIVNAPSVLSIADSLDTAGASTGIGIAVDGFWAGSNQDGTTTPGGAAALFDAQATRDNAFGHTGNFGGDPDSSLSTVDLTGLDGSGATSYNFTFFGSRMGPSDNRETQYTVSGINSGMGLLNATGNTDNVAVISGIIPSAAGEISILVNAGPNNNNGSKFYYLGAMEIVSAQVPEPTSLGLLALAGIGVVLRRRR